MQPRCYRPLMYPVPMISVNISSGLNCATGASVRKRSATMNRRSPTRLLNPNSEIGMGGTGDPPVSSGHWPDGRDRTLALKNDARKIPGPSPVPGGGPPLGTGRWPVLPSETTAATSEFGLNLGLGRGGTVDVRRLLAPSPSE